MASPSTIIAEGDKVLSRAPKHRSCYTLKMITKAALLLFREHDGQKELLFARAKDKPFYVFPGGKQEPDETIEEALQRELDEELGTQAADICKLGVVAGKTPDDRDIEMHLYTGNLQDEPQPHSEIEEIIWLTRDAIEEKRHVMTPMTLDKVLPFLTEQKLL